MIKGIGIDIEEISRITELVARKPSLVDRILTSHEKKYYLTLSQKRQNEFVAGRYVAKEAFAKAFGTGIGAQLSFLDIEVLNDELGKPLMKCAKFHGRIHVSISHTKELVTAEVMLEE